MNRRERREKERELSKREEKLRKQEENLSKEKPRRNRMKLVVGICYGIIGFGLAFGSYYAVARPHLSIEPYLPLSPVDPYSTQFTVKNENPMFEVHDVHCVCWPKRTKFPLHTPVTPDIPPGHTVSIMESEPGDHTTEKKVSLLVPGGSSTFDCPSWLAPFGVFVGGIVDADLEINVSYSQSWWPFGAVKERFVFSTKKDSQGVVHWVHITPAEEVPLPSVSK